VECAQQQGVRLHWNCPVTGLERKTIRTGDSIFTADWIVGADGLHSRVRQWIGIGVRHGPTRYGLRRHFQVEPWSDLVEVHWADDCEAYVTPVGDREVGVAILRDASKLGFDQLFARFPALSLRLAGSPASSRQRGAGPFWSLPKKVVSRNVALVGDAAGYLDAITGEGLSLAFHQSEALTDALVSGDLAGYQRAVRDLMRLPGALIRALLFIERHPSMRRRLIRTLADEPEVFSRLLEVHTRQITPHQLGLGNAARLVLGLALSG
jgi:flavin-dependent dehydrogenase